MNKNFIELQVKENPFEEKINFSDMQWVPEQQYPLISTKDMYICHCAFKAGVINYVTGILARKILEKTDDVKLYQEKAVKQKDAFTDDLVKQVIEKLNPNNGKNVPKQSEETVDVPDEFKDVQKPIAQEVDDLKTIRDAKMYAKVFGLEFDEEVRLKDIKEKLYKLMN